MGSEEDHQYWADVWWNELTRQITTMQVMRQAIMVPAAKSKQTPTQLLEVSPPAMNNPTTVKPYAASARKYGL